MVRGRGGKILVFVFVFLVVFGFSDRLVYADPPNSDATCTAISAGHCEDAGFSSLTDCRTNFKKFGTCDVKAPPKKTQICCIPTNPTQSDTECKALDPGATCARSCPTTGFTRHGTCRVDGTIPGTISCCVPDGTASTSTASTPSSTASLQYTPLENLPGFEGQGGDFASYFGALYKLALWIVGISALFMLVVGGFLYLSSAGNTSLLNTAKKTIYSALIGLVIALVSWLLLDTINGDLTNLHLSGLTGATGVSNSGAGGSPGTGATPGPGGSSTSGTYTHAEAVAALSAAGIGVTSSTGCLGKDADGCTTLDQIPKAAIDNLIAIKKDCGCSFDVTGGTETAGHVSHGPGLPIVDVKQDPTLGNFLCSKAGGCTTGDLSKSPGYGISKICVMNNEWAKMRYSCPNYWEKQPHFHLAF